MRKENEKYCFSCGTSIDSRAVNCPKCGVAQPDISVNTTLNTHWLAVLLLALLLGIFGAHRFYLRRTGSAILMLITIGGLGIWYLVDLIMIITGNFRDHYGRPIKLSMEK